MASRAAIGRGTEFPDPSIRRIGLGLGCAGLMQLPSRRQRQRLLGEAHAQGIAHFDLARMYGLGMAEAELGLFARGRREQITIATKFGIEPGSPRLARLQAPARAALAHLPALRAALRRRGSGPRPPRRYDAAAARASLETSLRELGTDYVDVFFVHDPAPADYVDLDGLGELCEELIESGKIRAWGVSGDQDPCLELARAGAGSVLQVRDEIFEPFPGVRGGTPPRTITFGVLASALARIQGHLAASEERRERWRAAVGRDCARADVLVSLLLGDALDRNRGGTVLFGTTRPERIGPALAAAEQATHDPDSLLAFRDCVRRDFPGAGGELG